MVQLKGANVNYSSSSSEFQFLMVQLKGSYNGFGYRCYHISIPYGSIKRNNRKSTGVRLQRFQFLMVQLKDKAEITGRKEGWISIPYGSIKRLCRTKKLSVKIQFQFLMVQLKDSCLTRIGIR